MIKLKSTISISGVIMLLLFTTTSYSQKITHYKIKHLIEKSEILKEHFTGFTLFDQDNDKIIYEQNGNKHFIPASNTKMYTFYTVLEMLGDSIPALKYAIKGDSLLFWGTGDPTLAYESFKSNKVLDFLKNSEKKLFFVSNNYKGNFYGSGWNYDDYEEYFQPEMNSFPIEGNITKITANSNGELVVQPSLLRPFFKVDTKINSETFIIKRDFYSNRFTFPSSIPKPGFKKQIPFKTSPELALAILKEKTKKEISLIDIVLPESFKIIYSEKTDDVLREMMLFSDNFIAEQLLLVCSSTLTNDLSTNSIIEYSKTNFMKEFANDIAWVDGSGLSRYNLITPNTSVALLKKISEKINDDDRLHSLFPAGGISGTLKRAYKTDDDNPFVWAKTGTLTNVHNQSGYIITKNGKRLIYSFMNNNFTRTTLEIRNEMVRIITKIFNEY
ncbi:D-alanyl-D-alanine carboxypeptidase [Flavobacterium franklandianum]|uniref:Peptidase S13 n=1 Tax=Flavobacterium franklandianum TaxID=2594430 RepID=A0A553CNI3_9FLAO|nr:D-alanyl-D-alanine carboxypeptidase [Flavobacterium franklandianum]TRX22037.1 peptidase S13 [Flavobacterium franklandianum]